MIIALTGTPGCGKTTVADELGSQGITVISLHTFLEENGLLDEFDESTGSFEVDMEAASEAFSALLDSEDTVVVEGHLSHLLPCDKIVVLRCNPSIIERRLLSRSYNASKVRENMEAEALDIILVESLDTGRETFELDCSSIPPAQAALAVKEIIDGEGHKYLPGDIDWSEELLRWC